ncbi:MAG: ABC transporter permease [Micromonosporaceae bacterium]
MTGAELARMRHGFLFWYSLLAPVVVALPLYLAAARSPEAMQGRQWDVFSNVTLELWGVLVPMTAGLAASLSVHADRDAWRLLLSYGVPRWRYFVGKFVALTVLQLASATVLVGLLGIGAVMHGKLVADLHVVLGGAYLPWFAALATLAIVGYVAMRWGLGVGIAVGVFGLFSGALMSDKDIWWAVPTAWPMRVILPLAGIGPNGIPLSAESPLRDLSVLPAALGLSLGLAALVLWAGSRHLQHKQI